MVSKRRRAREMALQMLYQRDLGGASCGQIFHEFRPSEYLESAAREDEPQRGRTARRASQEDQAFDYAKSLLEGTVAHLEEIDGLIRQQAEHWRLERMPAVDRNILRLAVYEFLYESDVPKLVVLDEAIELAKEFGAEQSGRFVNGLLDGILKSHSFPGSLT
ncbi:MAG: transcription antitermination factor NusB [Thermoanaerobaculia bacterium]